MKASKTPLYAFYVLLFTTAFNCSKTDDNVIPIVGTWTATTQSSTGCRTLSNNYVQTFVCPVTANNSCYKITFGSSGTFTQSSSIGSSGSINTTSGSGTYSVSGNKLTITPTGVAPETVTFVLSGNTMTITFLKDNSTGCIDTMVLTK
jgi:hypothetical protein